MMCNDFGRCVLSLSELHDVSGMSRSTITAANQILQDKNYIAKQRYVTYEGDYGHNRVYVTHILRNLHTMKCAETIRILVNGGEMSYSVKCILEGAMQADRKTAYQMLRKEIRRLFRSTKVAKFIRKLRRNRNVTAIFLGKKHGSLRKICRLLYSYLL
jgi:DNA-binding transcriptional regulator GbsR (MarR family)